MTFLVDDVVDTLVAVTEDNDGLGSARAARPRPPSSKTTPSSTIADAGTRASATGRQSRPGSR
jgi:hypothetical protein